MTAPASLSAVLLRLGAGWAGSVLAGLVVFGLLDLASRISEQFGVFRGMGLAVLVGGQPPVQCVTVGALAAAVFALVRTGRPAGALGLVAGVVAFVLGLFAPGGWPRAVSRPLWWLTVGAGAFAVAAVFDRLAARGYRLGKCLVVGPLLGGLYVAATPTVLLEAPPARAVLPDVLMYALLGIVIGDGVAFGVEMADLLPGMRRRRTARRQLPAGETT